MPTSRSLVVTSRSPSSRATDWNECVQLMSTFIVGFFKSRERSISACYPSMQLNVVGLREGYYRWDNITNTMYSNLLSIHFLDFPVIGLYVHDFLPS